MNHIRLLHLFNWKLTDITNELKLVKEQNFNAILINPLQELKEDSPNTLPWWMSYQPRSFNIGNPYGSKEELALLCEKAEHYDIKIIADAICNHMGGTVNGSEYNPTPHESVDKNLSQNPNFWKTGGILKDESCWNDRQKVISASIQGLPGLNLANNELQEQHIFPFLEEYIALGVAGLRFDAAKNIALPEEDNTCQFWPEVVRRFSNKILLAEVLNVDQSLTDQYINQGLNVITDLYNLTGDNLMKFAESHDSYLSPEVGYTSHLSDDQINHDYQALTKKENKTLYYARPFSNSWKRDLVKHSNNQKC